MKIARPLLFVFLLACNAKVATVLESSDSGAAPPASTQAGASCTNDQECNDDPSISGLLGQCTPSGCVCKAGFALTSRGKCAGNGAASPGPCTPGQDQSCNDDPAMSTLAGTCNPDATCACHAPYVKLASGKCGNGPMFPDYLLGTWVIGLSGGSNHFSFVRFDQASVAQYLADVSKDPGYVPRWRCSGTGAWTITQKPSTFLLTFPGSCGLTAEAYTVDAVGAPSSNDAPVGALLQASLTSEISGGPALVAWKLPDATCDATFTSCSNPFKQ